MMPTLAMTGLSGLSGMIAGGIPGNAPGTAVDVDTGNDPWGNPGNVYVSDNTYAAVALDSSRSNTLRVTNFGFAIPAGATINGITVRIERRAITSGGVVQDYRIQLRKSGGVAGDDKASATAWPATDAVATYGGVADLWGTTWTATEVNNSGFGVEIEAVGTVNPMTAQVDYVTIQVSYTAATSSSVLLESGGYLLTEAGDYLLLEA